MESFLKDDTYGEAFRNKIRDDITSKANCTDDNLPNKLEDLVNALAEAIANCVQKKTENVLEKEGNVLRNEIVNSIVKSWADGIFDSIKGELDAEGNKLGEEYYNMQDRIMREYFYDTLFYEIPNSSCKEEGRNDIRQELEGEAEKYACEEVAKYAAEVFVTAIEQAFTEILDNSIASPELAENIKTSACDDLSKAAKDVLDKIN